MGADASSESSWLRRSWIFGSCCALPPWTATSVLVERLHVPMLCGRECVLRKLGLAFVLVDVGGCPDVRGKSREDGAFAGVLAVPSSAKVRGQCLARMSEYEHATAAAAAAPTSLRLPGMVFDLLTRVRLSTLAWTRGELR